jgi:uncharacterized membrane protein
MTSAVVEAVHGMAAVAWVGGIFFAFMALRPAANAVLDGPQRLRLWQSAYRHFFPWVWLMIALLLTTGYADLWMRFGGIGSLPLYLKLMHGIGWLMVLLFAYLYFGVFRRLTVAVGRGDTAAAAAAMARARPLMAINLTLGMILTLIGIAGPTF